MNVAIVTCFESNEERVGFIADTFKARKDNVEIITTSFSHIKKVERDNYPSFYGHLNIVPTKSYRKNISIERLLSHKQFAKEAFLMIENINPDIIWTIAPCNSLIREANKYKAKHSDTKIVIDIIDMWPESLPIRANKNNCLFNMWRNIRRNNINCADILVSECNLYKDILKQEYNNKIETLLWSREGKALNINTCNNKKLSLCYIGSINNIIDIDAICNLIKKLNTNIELHIIGDGESRNDLISKAKSICEVIYHGSIYDMDKKKDIMSKCHTGLNIYKNNLYIGLTVKTMDYLQFGMPIINSVKGDTYELIKKEKVGFNIEDDFTYKDIMNLRSNNKNIMDVYNKYFTKKVFVKKCNEIIDEVCK